MNKKFFVSLAIALCTILAFTVCFANTNGDGLEKAANDVRNVVGGVENTVENAAMDISNTSKDVTGGIENNVDGNKNTTKTTNAVNDGKYTTSRVNTGNATVMGMTSTAWTWLILGIAAIAIIAVVWYYSMQFTSNNNHHNDE